MIADIEAHPEELVDMGFLPFEVCALGYEA
jgi:hypothetical protein